MRCLTVVVKDLHPFQFSGDEFTSLYAHICKTSMGFVPNSLDCCAFYADAAPFLSAASRRAALMRTMLSIVIAISLCTFLARRAAMNYCFNFGAQGLIRGTLSVRERTCGKQNCKCARGEKHASLYLVVNLDGKYKQMCVPKSLEEEVRTWVAQYQRAQELIEEISKAYWDKLQNREE